MGVPCIRCNHITSIGPGSCDNCGYTTRFGQMWPTSLNTIECVREFHRGFDLPHDEEPGIPEQIPEAAHLTRMVVAQMEELGRLIHSHAKRVGGDDILLRLQLIQEEAAEVGRALVNQDLENLLKELCDLRYVVDGTTLFMGLDSVFTPAFLEVQRSNMSKLIDPTIDEAGRVNKGPSYSKAELGPILNGAILRGRS